jgi:hypothetical protein
MKELIGWSIFFYVGGLWTGFALCLLLKGFKGGITNE